MNLFHSQGFPLYTLKEGWCSNKMMQNQPIIENIREGMNLFYNTLGQEKVDCFIWVKQINSGFMPLYEMQF